MDLTRLITEQRNPHTLAIDELATLDAVSKLPAEYPGWMIERQNANRPPA